MPLTKLDEVAALIVVDLQKGIVSVPTVHPTGEIIQRSATLARAFRERKLPVVLVNVIGAAPGRVDAPRPNFAPPPDWADLAPNSTPNPAITWSANSAGAHLSAPISTLTSAAATSRKSSSAVSPPASA